MDLIWLIPICFGAYMVGNFNLAVALTRSVLKKDIRAQGSGNPGATNMLRNFGFKWGLVVFLYDLLKGVVPVLVAHFLFDERVAVYAVALSVVLGHCFPVLGRFRGGKGVATMVGAFLVINPIVTPIAFAVGLVAIFLFHYGALSSLLFITIVVPWQMMADRYLAVSLILIAFYCLVLFTHRGNIWRLLLGKENKARIFGRRRK